MRRLKCQDCAPPGSIALTSRSRLQARSRQHGRSWRFEAEDEVAQELSESLAKSLLAEGGWYADFTVQDEHVVVFADRIFRYAQGDKAGRAAAEAYGRSVGVPDHQLDWGD